MRRTKFSTAVYIVPACRHTKLNVLHVILNLNFEFRTYLAKFRYLIVLNLVSGYLNLNLATIQVLNLVGPSRSRYIRVHVHGRTQRPAARAARAAAAGRGRPITGNSSYLIPVVHSKFNYRYLGATSSQQQPYQIYCIKWVDRLYDIPVLNLNLAALIQGVLKLYI
eukprot:SAG31_NODE_1168_length_9568_cov_2.700708_2_plen_166_part_00